MCGNGGAMTEAGEADEPQFNVSIVLCQRHSLVFCH